MGLEKRLKNRRKGIDFVLKIHYCAYVMINHIKNVRLGLEGERLAKKMLRSHFTNVRKQTWKAPFDYTGIDKVTGDRVAIEVKTVRKDHGKLVHIETEAMLRKLNFAAETDRKSVVLLVVKNGETRFYLTALKQHISAGSLVEIH